jgi:circadian clock protein KaiC
LYVLKSRGMAHSNERREFALTDLGLNIRDSAGEPSGTSDDFGHAAREGQHRHAPV